MRWEVHVGAKTISNRVLKEYIACYSVRAARFTQIDSFGRETNKIDLWLVIDHP